MLTYALAVCLGATALQPAMTSQAEAGWGSVIGTAIGAGVQAEKERKEAQAAIDYFNTEEGRHALYDHYRETYGVNYDSYLNSRIEGIMTKLTQGVAAVDPSIWKMPYLWFINQEKSFNASCGMGHVMLINTGLFNVIQYDDEIAAVLAHEIVHGQKNQVAEGLKKNISKKAWTSVGVAAMGGGTLAQGLGSFAYGHMAVHSTKAREKEADNIAFEYITHTDYNPGCTAAVWQRVIDLMGDNVPNTATTILSPSDHPNNSSRRDNYENHIFLLSGKHVHANGGKVQVNGKDFVAPVAAHGMSGAERSYYVQGNLAAAYKNGHSKSDAYVQDGTVMLGAQPIFTPAAGDESAETLAQRLNSIK